MATLALMDFRTTIDSAFLKQCPHCREVVSSRTLVSVPRKSAPRWYQLTLTPHTACPKCGGYVVSTMANSRWLFLPMAYFVVLIGSLQLETRLGDILISWWGQGIAFALFAVVFWHVASRSELKREP